jgi:hypothetical protein
MAHEYPVGKAQQQVLAILVPERKVMWASTAEAIFADFGISVRAKRVGRGSQPVVTIHATSAEWNGNGDADVVPALNALTPAQIEILKAWTE